MSRAARQRSVLPLLLTVGICFFATGSAGLIYEIIWNRLLALLMGNTPYALATLLTVFMGGLALGAWIGGHWTPHGRWALRAYGLMELGIGVYCLFLPWMLDAAQPLFARIYREHYSSLLVFNLVQFVVVGGLLLIPTTLMGATLPILTNFLVTRLGVLSRTVGALYAVNSGGACAGALLAGLYLLPSFGVGHSLRLAVAINLVVGLAAIGLSYVVAPPSDQPPMPPPRPMKEKRPRTRMEPAIDEAAAFPRAVLWIGFGLSGFAAMVYQVAWTRAVTLSIGSSTYAFTLIAGAFILGLTLGSAGLAWMGDRRWGKYAAAVLPMLIGLSALLTVVLLGNLPVRATRIIRAADSFGQLERAKFSAVFFMFLPATFCMGGLLPIVCRLAAHRREEAGRSVGNAYAANALGTILGSFCGGFLLIPWLGMRWSILIGAGISLGVGSLFLYHALAAGARARASLVGAVWAVTILIILFAPPWDRSVMTSGPFVEGSMRAGNPQESDAEIIRKMQENIVYYEEGVTALVTVTEEKGGRRSLIVSGKPDAYSYASTQNWLGHLPLFLRPRAADVLIIGLGSGHTLGSVLCHPNVQTVDCVEISPEVAHAARAFFSQYTSNALDDSRVNLILGDGRLHLAHTDRTYDVIVSQPSNPWMAGASALFTRECFDRMKRCLNPGGAACIWFQGFRMPVENFQILSRTWADTWEHPSIWTSRISGEHLFVGSDVPLSIDFAAVDARFEESRVAVQMQSIKMPTPADVFGYLTVVDEGVQAVGGEAPVNTDDNSRIEYDTPKGLWKDRTQEILALLHSQRTDPWRFVIDGGAAQDRFQQSKARGAQILSDQFEIMRSLKLSTEERRRILDDILQHNPNDPTADRERKKIRN